MRFDSLVTIGVLWTLLFLSVMASTRLGAMIFGDTLIFLLSSLCLLFVSCVVVPLVGIVMSTLRRRWKPLLLGLVSLPASLLVAYLVLALGADRGLTDRVRGQPELAADYIGTQNAATLTLRRNGRFDIFWTGWPGAVHFYAGRWHMQGAELRLQFEGRRALPDRGTMGSNVIVFESTEEGTSHRFVIERRMNAIRSGGRP